jgi:hypothetical protein
VLSELELEEEKVNDDELLELLSLSSASGTGRI